MTCDSSPRISFRALLTPAVLAVMLAASLAAGCAPRRAASDLTPPTVPARPDRSTPETAVRSYLDWVTFSYRMADSSISTPTMDAYEAVRIDSYIELNRQKNRGIEQRLVSFSVRSTSEESTTVVIASSEEWRYRYFTLDTKRYDDEPHTASYEVTYTVVRQGRDWVVGKVDATPLTPVE